MKSEKSPAPLREDWLGREACRDPFRGNRGHFFHSGGDDDKVVGDAFEEGTGHQLKFPTSKRSPTATPSKAWHKVCTQYFVWRWR